jgi:hypothetical protein
VADLDEILRRYLEQVDRMQGIAEHEGEQRQPSARQLRPPPAANHLVRRTEIETG